MSEAKRSEFSDMLELAADDYRRGLEPEPPGPVVAFMWIPVLLFGLAAWALVGYSVLR